MEKTKKQILLFIIIIIVGVGYVINEYIMAPKKLLIQEKSIQLEADKQKLNLLTSMISDVSSLNEEVAKLKKEAESIEEVTVKDINTPQLIFDFYNSCKDHGIKGENLVFQLADGDTNVDETTSEATDITDENADENQTEVVTEGVTTENTNNDISKIEATSSLLKLTIDLKVSGDKDKVEDYIRSLTTLTSRKINVKSIKLEATVAETITDEATGEETDQLTNEVNADISFNQYIFSNDEEIIRLKNYSFYDENIGYSNFADMFK